MNEQELVIINRQFSPNCSKRLMPSELLLQLELLKVQTHVKTRTEDGDSQTASPSGKHGRGFDTARGDGEPGRRQNRGSGESAGRADGSLAGPSAPTPHASTAVGPALDGKVTTLIEKSSGPCFLAQGKGGPLERRDHVSPRVALWTLFPSY